MDEVKINDDSSDLREKLRLLNKNYKTLEEEFKIKTLEFEKKFIEILKKSNIKKETAIKEDTNNKNIDEKKYIKKLFKKISLMTHPDKVNDIKKNDIFNNSNNAKDELNLMELVNDAEKLNINFKELDKDNIYTKDYIFEKIIEKTKKINKIKTSLVYHWYTLKLSDECIKNILLSKK